jgi:hypothetical protein
VSALRPRNIYIAAMCAAGLALAGATLMWPDVVSGYASAFTILLIVSFIIDLVLMRMSRGDDVMPVSMEARFSSFFAGMIIYLAVTALFGAPAA